MSHPQVHPSAIPSRTPWRRWNLALLSPDGRPPAAIRSILLAAGLPARVVRASGDIAGGEIDAVVLVVDPDRPGGLAAVRRIRRDAPTAKIVLVALGAGRGTGAREALNAGGDAYVPERDAAHLLVPALEAVMAGFVCTPRHLRRLVAKPTFSHREKQILGLMVEGLTNRQIAGRLYLAESTVKSHLASGFAKLGVRSRKDAAALLLDREEGLAAIALPRGADAAIMRDGAEG